MLKIVIPIVIPMIFSVYEYFHNSIGGSGGRVEGREQCVNLLMCVKCIGSKCINESFKAHLSIVKYLL